MAGIGQRIKPDLDAIERERLANEAQFEAFEATKHDPRQSSKLGGPV